MAEPPSRSRFIYRLIFRRGRRLQFHEVTVFAVLSENTIGGRCRRRPKRGRTRCLLHGGASTGARVHRARDMRVTWAARAARVAMRRALGLRSPGGRPRKLSVEARGDLVKKAVAKIEAE